MAQGGKEAVQHDEDVFASPKVRALDERSGELERVLGKRRPWRTRFSGTRRRLPMKETDLALAIIARRGFAVKTVADEPMSKVEVHAEKKKSRLAGPVSNASKVLTTIR